MLYKLLELKELKTSEYIYCLQFKDKLKIGKSINPYTRARTLRTQSGEELLNIFVVQSDFKLEQLAHQHFAKYRTIGEYFKGLDFNEVCQWLEENRIEVKDLDMKKIERSKEEINSLIQGFFYENYVPRFLDEIDEFTEDLILKIVSKNNVDKIKRNIFYLNQTLKDIYTGCLLKECKYIGGIKDYNLKSPDIITNLIKTYCVFMKNDGFKNANNWLYKFKRDFLNRNIEDIFKLSNTFNNFRTVL